MIATGSGMAPIPLISSPPNAGRRSYVSAAYLMGPQ